MKLTRFSDLNFRERFGRLPKCRQLLFLASCMSRVSVQFAAYWARRTANSGEDPVSKTISLLWREDAQAQEQSDSELLEHLHDRLSSLEPIYSFPPQPGLVRAVQGEHSIGYVVLCGMLCIEFIRFGRIEDAEGAAETVYDAVHNYAVLRTHRFGEAIDANRVDAEGSEFVELERQLRDLIELESHDGNYLSLAQAFRRRAAKEAVEIFPTPILTLPVSH